MAFVLFAACSPRQAAGPAGAPQDPLAGFESTGRKIKCVQSYEIRETRVLDDDDILFRLGVSRYLVNRLPRTCHGLKLQGRFEYTLRGGNELCSGDAIRILDGTGTGGGCILGEFEELAKKK